MRPDGVIDDGIAGSAIVVIVSILFATAFVAGAIAVGFAEWLLG